MSERRVPVQNDMPDGAYIEVLRPFAADLAVEVNGLLDEIARLRARVAELERPHALYEKAVALEEVAKLRARVAEYEEVVKAARNARALLAPGHRTFDETGRDAGDADDILRAAIAKLDGGGHE